MIHFMTNFPRILSPKNLISNTEQAALVDTSTGRVQPLNRNSGCVERSGPLRHNIRVGKDGLSLDNYFLIYISIFWLLIGYEILVLFAFSLPMKLAIWIYAIHDAIQLENIRVYGSNGYICEEEFGSDKHIRTNYQNKSNLLKIKKNNTTTLRSLAF